jgi:cytochrome c oxidase subunit 2
MRIGLLVAVLAGCPGESAPIEPGSPERGAPIYAAYCISCHQADGSGVLNGARMAGAFSGPESRLGQPDAVLLQSIADGKVGPVGTMPPWKAVLNEQQRADVLAYVRATYAQ